MIEAAELVKTFPTPDGREKRAVDGLSFRADRGQIYGLLGPNGAGKTTTLRMLSGLIRPDSGRAVIGGFDVARSPMQVKRRIGFLTASTGLYQRLTPRELLMYFADLHDLAPCVAKRRVHELIGWLQMEEFADLRCGCLSTGQRQRASIARALIGDPPVLIMDEPTLGLDVLTNRLILEFIRMQKQLGKSILLCTHYLDEAESLCDMIGLIHRGRIVAEGTLPCLQTQFGPQRLTDIFLSVVQRELGTTVEPDVQSVAS